MSPSEGEGHEDPLGHRSFDVSARCTDGKPLPMAKLLVLSATTWLPWRPLGVGFDFEPLAVNLLIFMGVIVLLRVLAADAMKRLFYRKTDPMTPVRHD